MIFIGIDLGTSSVKSILLDAAPGAGRETVLGEATVPLTVDRPHPGWSEQDPESWWQATLQTLDALASAHPDAMRAVAGIGLSGQMHGATLLDAEGRILRPAILWNDVRSGPECAELAAEIPDAGAICGNAFMPGFTAPKLRWVAKHEPDIFARIAKILLPKDYLRWRLSGRFVGDMSDAAGTCWLAVGERAWSERMIEGTGITRTQLPDLVEGSAVSASLDPALARRFGMTGDIPIAGGAGDNAAAACGIGAVTPGRAFLSLGTSGVLFVSTDKYQPNVQGGVHTFCHAVPDTWHQMGVILSATDSIEWLSRLLATPSRTLTAALGERVARPSPVLFLPYLSGERTPHNDGALRGAFAGIGHEADRNLMTQAVLEGVAFAFRDCRDALADAGTTLDHAWAVGGGANSDVWLQIMANVLDTPLSRPQGAGLGAAFGAARLAMAAATGADPRTICLEPEAELTIEPERHLVGAYDEAHARYRALAPALKDIASR